MKTLESYIGRYARSIESGWLGKVVGVDNYDGLAMLRMQGVNTLCRDILGGDLDDHLDADDTQWFTVEDVRLVTLK